MSPNTPMDDEQSGVGDPAEVLEEAFEEEIEHAAELQEAETAGAKRPNVFLRLYRGETSFDFIGNRKWWFGISAIVIVIGIVIVIYWDAH